MTLERGWERARYRDVQIRSRLRPDFYAFFPEFSDYELLFRYRFLGPVRATLLNWRNVKRLTELQPETANEFRAFAREPFAKQRATVVELLQSLGFREFVTRGIGDTAREVFVPEGFRAFSYFDLSLPITKSSWISGWSIVSLYLHFSECPCSSGLAAIEVGLGTGYHAVALAKASKSSVLGYEIDEEARSIAEEIKVAEGFDFLSVRGAAPALSKLGRSKNTFVYATCRLSEGIWSELAQALPTNSVAIAPTAITRDEFAEDNRSPFFAKYNTYADYLLDQRKFLRLAMSVGGAETSLLYDLRFVPYLTTQPEAKNIPERPESVQWLATLLA